jgi:hypothetical protein
VRSLSLASAGAILDDEALSIEANIGRLSTKVSSQNSKRDERCPEIYYIG